MSVSYLAASITSISASLLGRVFFDARREKNPPIWFAVRKSSLWNILVPLISLACIIDRATDAGSAICPVISPSLNFLVRYACCASVNLVCQDPVTFNAQPISRFCVLESLVGTIKTIVVPCSSSCSAYWTAALSCKVSCSRVYWCLPQSKWWILYVEYSMLDKRLTPSILNAGVSTLVNGSQSVTLREGTRKIRISSPKVQTYQRHFCKTVWDLLHLKALLC